MVRHTDAAWWCASNWGLHAIRRLTGNTRTTQLKASNRQTTLLPAPAAFIRANASCARRLNLADQKDSQEQEWSDSRYVAFMQGSLQLFWSNGRTYNFVVCLSRKWEVILYPLFTSSLVDGIILRSHLSKQTLYWLTSFLLDQNGQFNVFIRLLWAVLCLGFLYV
jgi:hypothetical protein